MYITIDVDIHLRLVVPFRRGRDRTAPAIGPRSTGIPTSGRATSRSAGSTNALRRRAYSGGRFTLGIRR